MLQEGPRELRTAAYTAYAFAHLAGEFIEVIRDEVGEFAGIEVGPQVFQRVQLGRRNHP